MQLWEVFLGQAGVQQLSLCMVAALLALKIAGLGFCQAVYFYSSLWSIHQRRPLRHGLMPAESLY